MLVSKSVLKEQEVQPVVVIIIYYVPSPKHYLPEPLSHLLLFLSWI